MGFIRRLFDCFYTREESIEIDTRRVSVISLIAILIGAIAAASGGWLNGESMNSALVALMIGFAAMAVGLIVGFLFGIPKVVQEANSADPEGDRRYSQRVNTNLEQISDWLTKIIVGFGLIELRKVPWAFESLTKTIAEDIPHSVSSTFAGAVLIYFAVVGFFVGYLLTRLYLAAVFGRADQQQFRIGVDLLRSSGAGNLEEVEIPERILKILDSSPASAIVVAYQDFSNAVRDVANQNDVPHSLDTRHQIDALYERKLVNESQYQRIVQLGELRDVAIHQGDKAVSRNDAEFYIRSTEELTRNLKQQ